jgi:hypothetical protein
MRVRIFFILYLPVLGGGHLFQPSLRVVEMAIGYPLGEDMGKV